MVDKMQMHTHAELIHYAVLNQLVD